MPNYFIIKSPVSISSLDMYPTGYSSFLADAILTADYHGDRWVNGLYSSGEGYVGFGQYEPWLGFRKLAEHIGGSAELEAQAVAAGDAWRDGYSIPNNNAVPGYYHYTDGFRVDWTNNADELSKFTVTGQAVRASYAGNSPISWQENQDASRETSYAMLGYINSEVFCGTPHNDRMEALRELTLGDVGDQVTHNADTVDLTSGGHIEQWLGSYTSDSNGNYVSGDHNFELGAFVGTGEQGYAPFMGAISAWTLISDYENYASISGMAEPDSRIIPKLERLFDATWNEYWIEGIKSMKYRWWNTDTNMPFDTQAIALNNEMFPIYSWLYLKTGRDRHREHAAKLFNGTVGYESLIYRTGNPPPLYAVKEFNELIRWVFDGLDWYASGVNLHG